MRLLCCMLAASVVVLWGVSASKASRSENRTKHATLDFPAGPLSPLASTSVSTGLLEPHTEPGDGIDRGYENDEERAPFEIEILHENGWLWSKLEAVTHFGKLAEQTDDDLRQKLIVWLGHVHTFNERKDGIYGNKAVVEVLGIDRLAALLNSLRKVPGVSILAKVMQKAFAKAYLNNWGFAIPVWLMERINQWTLTIFCPSDRVKTVNVMANWRDPFTV